MKVLAFCAALLLPSAALAQDGRLTPTAGSPVLTADVVAAPTLYYSPIAGRASPSLTIAGTSYPITSGPLDANGTLSLSLAGLSSGTAYDIFAQVVGATPQLVALPMPSPNPTVTVTPLADNVVLTTGTGGTAWLRSSPAFNGTSVQPAASSAWVGPSNTGMANFLGQDFGALQSVGQVVVTAPSDDYLRGDATTALASEIDASDDGASWSIAWSGPLDTSGSLGKVQTITFPGAPHRYWRVGFSGNGVNAIKPAQIQFSTVVIVPPNRGLVLYNGLWVNGAAVAGCAQYACTYLGSILTDKTGPTVTAQTSYGLDRVYGVANAYNRVRIRVEMGDPSPPVGTPPTHAYQPATTGGPPTYAVSAVNSKPTNRITIVSALADEFFHAHYHQEFYLDALTAQSAYWAGIGWNSTTALFGTRVQGTIDQPGTAIGFLGEADYSAPPFFGPATISALEGRAGNTYADYGSDNTLMTVDWMN